MAQDFCLNSQSFQSYEEAVLNFTVIFFIKPQKIIFAKFKQALRILN